MTSTTSASDIKSAPENQGAAPANAASAAGPKAPKMVFATGVGSGSFNAFLQSLIASAGGCGDPNCHGCGSGSAIKRADTYKEYTGAVSDTFGNLSRFIPDVKTNDAKAVIAEINRLEGAKRWSREQCAVVVYELYANKRIDVINALFADQSKLFSLLPYGDDINEVAFKNDLDLNNMTILGDFICVRFTDENFVTLAKKGDAYVNHLRYILSKSPKMRVTQSDVNDAFLGGHPETLRWMITEHKVVPTDNPMFVFDASFRAGRHITFDAVQKCIRVLVETKTWTPYIEDINSITQLELRRAFIKNCLPDGYQPPSRPPEAEEVPPLEDINSKDDDEDVE